MDQPTLRTVWAFLDSIYFPVHVSGIKTLHNDRILTCIYIVAYTHTHIYMKEIFSLQSSLGTYRRFLAWPSINVISQLTLYQFDPNVFCSAHAATSYFLTVSPTITIQHYFSLQSLFLSLLTSAYPSFPAFQIWRLFHRISIILIISCLTSCIGSSSSSILLLMPL